jgi:hypothetical protein
MTPRRASSPHHYPEGQRVHSATFGLAKVIRYFPAIHGREPLYMIDIGERFDARKRYVSVPDRDLRAV